MKILVLTTSYPMGDSVEAYFVHTRNLFYVEKGIDLTVLNFKADKSYYKDGIKVISLNDFNIDEVFDIVVSHAANIRQHYRFINKYIDKFKKIVFFFHGHEVFIQSQVYSKPYSYVSEGSILHKLITETYDRYKLILWKFFFLKYKDKVEFVFVSNWMKNMFYKFVKIDEKEFSNKNNIIYNSVGKAFETFTWDKNKKKEVDVISIRSNLDGSKYCVDIINSLAKNNPNLKFKLFGKGEFFKHNEKAPNIELIERNLSHNEILEEINKARVALLPTRTDAQGVMACELNIAGIPLITSDIEVCREVFKNIYNVALVSNEELSRTNDLERFIINLENNYKSEKSLKYTSKSTIENEVKLFNKMVDRKEND